MKESKLSGLKRTDFQSIIQGKSTDLFTLTNKYGHEVCITNYGGALVAIMVPDRNGRIANVIQGHDNINDVVTSPEPFLSTLIGRYTVRMHSTAVLPAITPEFGMQSRRTIRHSASITSELTAKKDSPET